jgi:putative aldouronate transport system substrate-binding protein
MKKTFFAVLTLLVIGLPLFAGGGRQGSGGGQSKSSQNANSLTLACLEGWYSAVSINDNLPIWQEMEKRSGIHINFQAIPEGSYNQTMQPVIASGSQLPDIMLIPPVWNNSGVFKLGQDGVIIPLDDLIAKHAPDIQKVFQQYPFLKAAVTAPDGKIYSICDTPMFVNDLVIPVTFLRKDWLDKLGLKEPTTIDEWHTVLTAFRDQDPNGNGRKDEVPLSSYQAGILAAGLSNFGSGFGLPVGYESPWWYDKSGKVFYVFASPQYRQLLQTMSQWYKEGLLDRELKRDEANLQSLVSTNVVGAFDVLAERQVQYNGFVRNVDPNVNHILVDPPKTPDGSRLQYLKRDPTWNHYGITKNCKNPELAIKWINFVWGSDEGVTLQEWGIEGQTYRVVNGKKEFTDFVTRNPNGLDPYNALRSIGASDTILVRTPAEVYAALVAGSDAIPYGERMRPYRVEPFPQVMLTDQQQLVLDRYNADFETYSNEIRTKLLIGELPFSEWDNYVRTLNSMGLAEIQAVKQYQYDRSK